MTRISFRSDKDGGIEQMAGSDERANVSSRSDSRAYYASRDNRKSFALLWSDESTAAGDYVAYIKNESITDVMVISHVSLNSELAATFEMVEVTGTAAGGTSSTLACNNRANPLVAQATARAADTSTVSGLTDVVELDHANCGAAGHEEFRSGDTIRIGGGGAIAIKVPVVASGPSITKGAVFVYFEESTQ